MFDSGALRRGDLIQITDATHHWFPAILVVDEVEAFGVQAACVVPQGSAAPGSTEPDFIRLEPADFERVGRAVVWLPDDGR